MPNSPRIIVEAAPGLVGEGRVLAKLLRKRSEIQCSAAVVPVVQVVLVLEAGRWHFNLQVSGLRQ